MGAEQSSNKGANSVDEGPGEDVTHEPPPLAEDDESVVMVAKSLKKAFSDMRETAGGQGWSAGDLSFGLWAVSRKRRKEVEEEIAGNEDLVNAPDLSTLLPELLHYGNMVRGTYHSKDDKTSRSRSGVSEEDFIHGQWESSIIKAPYFVAVNRDTKELVVCIRGTQTKEDIMTDMVSVSVQLGQSEDAGWAHRGALKSAQWVLDDVTPVLKKALESHPEHRVVFVGHSLGGAIATLCAVLTHRRKTFPDTRALTFAAPSCLDLATSKSVAPFVTSVVLRHDIIPRFCIASLVLLREEVVHHPWGEELLDALRVKRMMELTSSMAGVVGVGMSKTGGFVMMQLSKVTPNVVQTAAGKVGGAASSVATMGANAAVGGVKKAYGVATAPYRAAAGAVGGALGFKDDERNFEGPTTHLFPPGRVLHLVAKEDRLILSERPAEYFGTLHIASCGVADHRMPSYMRNLIHLDEQVNDGVQSPKAAAAAEALGKKHMKKKKMESVRKPPPPVLGAPRKGSATSKSSKSSKRSKSSKKSKEGSTNKNDS